MKKALCAVLYLCLALCLPLSACKKAEKPDGGDNTPVENTENAQEQPTPTVTLPPADYDFDRTSFAYSDEYLSFTLPAGQSGLNDATQPDDAILRYLSFFPEGGDGESDENTLYYVQNIGSIYDGAIYAYYTQEMFETELGAWNETSVETLRFEPVTGANYSGVIYEYTVTYDGTPMRQLIWSAARTDGVALTVIFTFGDEAEVNASAASIRVK